MHVGSPRPTALLHALLAAAPPAWPGRCRQAQAGRPPPAGPAGFACIRPATQQRYEAVHSVFLDAAWQRLRASSLLGLRSSRRCRRWASAGSAQLCAGACAVYCTVLPTGEMEPQFWGSPAVPASSVEEEAALDGTSGRFPQHDCSQLGSTGGSFSHPLKRQQTAAGCSSTQSPLHKGRGRCSGRRPQHGRRPHTAGAIRLFRSFPKVLVYPRPAWAQPQASEHSGVEQVQPAASGSERLRRG